MINEFAPYEEALAMKEIGFDEICFGQYFLFEGESEPILCYDEDQYHIVKDNPNVKIETIPSPTYSQAFRWFRKNFGGYHGVSDDSFLFELTINGEFIRVTSTPKQRRLLNSYEKFEEACLKKLIEIVRDETN